MSAPKDITSVNVAAYTIATEQVPGSPYPVELMMIEMVDGAYIPIGMRKPKGAGPFPLILFATGKLSHPGPVSAKTLVFLLLSGLGTGASWLCYFRALKLGPATLVAPIDKLSVVLVALFGVVFLGERPSLNGWLGIVLIAAGAVLIAFKR